MEKQLDFGKLTSKDPKIKYGFTKELLQIAASDPAMLSNFHDQWDKMLKSENNIFKWTAIDIIGYLSTVDKTDKTDKKIGDIIKFLHCGNMITANHAIFALGIIAQNKPDFRKKIINELIIISEDRFETDECKNIATGKVIEALNPFLKEIEKNDAVISFLREAEGNSRNATRKKAETLLKKIKLKDWEK